MKSVQSYISQLWAIPWLVPGMLFLVALRSEWTLIADYGFDQYLEILQYYDLSDWAAVFGPIAAGIFLLVMHGSGTRRRYWITFFGALTGFWPWWRIIRWYGLDEIQEFSFLQIAEFSAVSFLLIASLVGGMLAGFSKSSSATSGSTSTTTPSAPLPAGAWSDTDMIRFAIPMTLTLGLAALLFMPNYEPQRANVSLSFRDMTSGRYGNPEWLQWASLIAVVSIIILTVRRGSEDGVESSKRMLIVFSLIALAYPLNLWYSNVREILQIDAWQWAFERMGSGLLIYSAVLVSTIVIASTAIVNPE